MCSRLPGLVWKLWVLDRELGAAGGLYLLRDAQAARAYAAGPELAQLRGSGVARAVVTRLLPLEDSLSRRTFGLSAPDAVRQPEATRQPALPASAATLERPAGA